MSDFEDYGRRYELIREENKSLLDAFELWALGQGLSESTASKHKENINFYINEFLQYEGPKHAIEGVNEVGLFLGYWFIRKAMWANEENIKSNAASLKKFYDFLAEQGEVTPEAVRAMKARIKDDLPKWVATVKRYNDPTIEVEDVWQ